MNFYILMVFPISFIITILLYLNIKRILNHKLIIKKLLSSTDYLPSDEKKSKGKGKVKKPSKPNIQIITKLEKKLYDAAISYNVNRFISILSLIIILFFVLLFIITDSVFASLLSFIIIPLLTNLILKRRRKKRLSTMSSQLSNVVTSISASLKSGHSLMQSLNMIAKESMPPISLELEQLLQDINLGKTIEESIVKFADRNPIEELQILSMAILVNKETGGNLSYILDTTANTIRDRERIKGQVKSLTAQGRLSGFILFLMPLFIMIIIYLLNPSYMRPLFTTSIGQLLLILWLSGQIIGGLLIKKIIKIDW